MWWPGLRALVFADLHFEKGSSYARSGQLLPPYDTRTTLKRMMALVDLYRPEVAIALGDSLQPQAAATRLDEGERNMVATLGNRAAWIWIAGNHDPVPPSWLSGTIT